MTWIPYLPSNAGVCNGGGRAGQPRVEIGRGGQARGRGSPHKKRRVLATDDDLSREQERAVPCDGWGPRSAASLAPGMHSDLTVVLRVWDGTIQMG